MVVFGEKLTFCQFSLKIWGEKIIFLDFSTKFLNPKFQNPRYPLCHKGYVGKLFF